MSCSYGKCVKELFLFLYSLMNVFLYFHRLKFYFNSCTTIKHMQLYSNSIYCFWHKIEDSNQASAAVTLGEMRWAKWDHPCESINFSNVANLFMSTVHGCLYFDWSVVNSTLAYTLKPGNFMSAPNLYKLLLNFHCFHQIWWIFDLLIIVKEAWGIGEGMNICVLSLFK